MAFIELISAFIGSALSGLGLFALYKAWRDKNTHALYIWGGWGLILSALIAWAIAGGKDRGAALGMIIIIFQALIFIGYQAAQEKAQNKPSKTPKRRHIEREKTSPFAIIKTLMTGLWVSLGCGTLSFLTAIGLHEVFWLSGFHASNALVMALFLFPIIWAVLISLSLTSYRQKMKISFFSGLALINLAVITLSNGVV